MIFENFPKNPEKCLKVTHFWEFGCTQNASLLRMTVYIIFYIYFNQDERPLSFDHVQEDKLSLLNSLY